MTITSPAHRSTARHGSQRGSILLPAAASIMVGLVLLGTAHLAYLFYMKRELQNAADMAALSGVQMLRPALPGNCVAAIATAQAALTTQSALRATNQVETDIACGTWDPTTPATATDPAQQALHFSPEDHAPGQAIYVSLRSRIPAFVPLMRTSALRAEAIARLEPGEPLAAFSVSPQLLTLDDGLLTNLLASIGADLRGTTVTDRNGLANVMLTPAGLLQALGIDLPADLTIASLNELLALDANARIGGAELLRAALELARNGEEKIPPDDADPADLNPLTAAQISLLESLIAALVVADPVIQLGSLDNGPRGLFALINADDPNAALNTRISLGSIVDTVLAFATREKAIDVPAELDLLGVLRGSVKIGIVEPPSIGIGGVGTTAYGAQIRAFIHLCTSLQGCPPANNGRQPYGLLNLKVDIPIGIELITGNGTLDSLCERYDAQGNPLADITVMHSIGNICIGDISATDVFATDFSCQAPLKNQQLVELGLLSTNLLNVNTHIAASLVAEESTLSLTDVTGHNFDYTPENGNNLALGTTLSDLLILSLMDSLTGRPQPLDSPNPRKRAEEIWADSLNTLACNPSSGLLNYNGYDCRRNALKTSLDGIQSGMDGLIGNIADNLLRLDLLNLVGDLVTDLIGSLLPTDQCAGATLGLLGGFIPPYSGDANGCINKIETVLKNQILERMAPSTGLPLLVEILGGVLKSLLDPLGQTLANLLNTLGINLGQVRTELISLECGRPRAQLVH